MDRFDAMAAAGVLAITTGIGLIDYRVGLMVLGAALIGWALLGARAAVGAGKKQPGTTKDK